MADYPKYTWYIEDGNIIILEEDANEEHAYTTPASDNTDGILLRYVAEYSDPSSLSDQVANDDTLFLALVNYVKYRMLEDVGGIKRAAYYRGEFYRLVSRYRRLRREAVPMIQASRVDSLL